MYTLANTDDEPTLPLTLPQAEQVFKLTAMYSTGHAMPLEVAARGWFNIAAVPGVKDAVRPRNEAAARRDARP